MISRKMKVVFGTTLLAMFFTATTSLATPVRGYTFGDVTYLLRMGDMNTSYCVIGGAGFNVETDTAFAYLAQAINSADPCTVAEITPGSNTILRVVGSCENVL